MRKIWAVLPSILGLFFVQTEFGTAAGPNLLVADARTVLQITPDDRVLGNPDAPITIVEYASLGCPHCAHFTNDVLPEIKKAWIDTGKVKLVLRDFPLDEPSLRAAMIARCAPPDRFYAFADTFFASQEKWLGARDYREALARLAKFGGMGKDEFERLSQQHQARGQNRRGPPQRVAGARCQRDADFLHQRQQIQRFAHCGRIQQSPVEPCG